MIDWRPMCANGLMRTRDPIGVEIGSHGRTWDTLHGGYFSDPAVAHPLIETVRRHLARVQPDVLVDLGGGTGFVLAQLLACGATPGMTLVNLDYSEAQLAVTGTSGITCMRGSIDEFRRCDLAPDDRRFFLVMRSVLHYFGEDGLVPILRHVRSQARVGEIFVHQTARFPGAREASCINALYRKLRTQKWYPTEADLDDGLTDMGWRILEKRPAPPLGLTSVDLGHRYGLDTHALLQIRVELSREYGEIENVFRLLPDGFVAYLPYQVYVSEAVAR